VSCVFEVSCILKTTDEPVGRDLLLSRETSSYLYVLSFIRMVTAGALFVFNVTFNRTCHIEYAKKYLWSTKKRQPTCQWQRLSQKVVCIKQTQKLSG